MVRIIDYQKRQNENEESFFVLELQGDIAMVLSQTTGNYYATAKRTFVTSTFNEETCKSLLGKELPGSIVKEECDPFDHVVEETGEEITLAHRWVYSPDEVSEAKPDSTTLHPELQKAKVEQFSENGVPEPEMNF